MKKFDPLACGLVAPAAGLSPVPVHGVAWRQKWRNWWAGATIASPTTETTVPAKNSIEVVQRFVSLGDVDALNDYYEQETDYARYWARKVLSLSDDVPVILDSGRSSVALATRMLAHVGRHPSFRGIAGGLPTYVRKFFTVSVTEDGAEALAEKYASFRPVTGVFFEAGPELSYPEGKEVEELSIDLTSVDNDELVEAIGNAVEGASCGGTTCGCIVLPTVSESGRLLPVREVGALVDDLRSRGHNIFFVVDDEQGMARRDADAMADPLSYCDAYLFSASKALGGLLTASAFVMSEELVRIFLEKTQSEGFAPRMPAIAHFQFEPRFEKELPEWIVKRSAVSIPEIVAMNAAFMYFYQRGKGATFQERRLHQLAQVEAERRKIVAALSAIPGVKVVEPTAGRPLVPSIVSFEIDRAGVSTATLKKVLQEGATVVTPTAVGPYLRLDIPEYRSVPPVDVLAAKLARVLDGLERE